MDKKINILVSPDCEYCKGLKGVKNDDVEVIDVAKEENDKYMDKVKDGGIPSAFDAQGEFCEIRDVGDGEMIVECKDNILIVQPDESFVLEVTDEEPPKDEPKTEKSEYGYCEVKTKKCYEGK